MDLFELAGSESEKEPTGDLFDIAGQESIPGTGEDLFDFAGGGVPSVLPAEKPSPGWSETTPGYVEEIAARAPGVGFFPLAGYAPQAGEPMPKLGKEYPGPFGEKPPELQETRFLKRSPEPERVMGPEGVSFERPRKIQPRITDEPYFFRDVIMGTLIKYGEQWLAAGELASHFAGGMIEFLNPIPGLAGIGKMLTGASPEEQAQVIQELQEKFHPYLVYEPQTEAAKGSKKIVDWAFQKVRELGQFLGGGAQKITTPVLGKTMGSSIGATIGGSVEIIIPAFIFGRLAKLGTGKAKGQINIEENLKAIKMEVEELTEKRNLSEIESEISSTERGFDLGIGPTAELQSLYEKIFKEKNISIGKLKQTETGAIKIPLLAEGEEIGGIKLRQKGQEYIVSAIGRYNRAKETGKGMPTEALKVIMDQAIEEGMQVRAKNAERAGEYYAGLGFKKEGPDYVFGPNEYRQKLFDASVLGVQKMIAQERSPILGFGTTGQLQKVYESLRGLRKRTEPLPKYARSINLERQAIREEFKTFEVDLADLLPKKKVQTWDQTGKLADEILGDYQKIGQTLHKAEKGYALNAAEIEAARRINVTAVNRLAEMAETKGIKETNELIKTYADNIFKTVSDASSEAGRALNIHKKFVAPARLAVSLKSLKNGMNERQFKEFQEIAPLLSKDFEALTEMDMGKVQKFIDRLPDPKLKDYFFECWYNSILSGIPTHLVNFSGNTLWQAWNIPIHHPLVSAVDATISKFTGRERQIFFNEIFPMLAGIKSGAKKGWGGVKEVIRTGQATEFQTKWDKEIGGGAVSAFERSPYAGIRAIAPYITAPSRALRAMDIWANSIAYDAKMQGLIRREGLKRGLEGEKLEKFERELQPTEAMMKEAGEYAKYITFMDDPGPIATSILKLREKVPLGRLVVPFVTTIGNLLKRGLEMTPGIGAFMGKGRMPAEVIAKQIEGSIISFWVMKKCLDGDITGPVPENPNERESFYRQGKLPWSIRIGGRWFQYRRLEPFNTVIASVAIAYDKIMHAKSQDDAANIFYDVTRGILENFLDTSYFSGPVQMLQRHGNVANMGLRQLSSMVPFSGFWRSINRALETVFEDNAKVREVKTVLGAFSQVIPGLWKEVPAKIDVWGEEIELPGNALRQWLPWKYSEAGGDQVEEELDRLKIYPSHPAKQIMILDKKIELPTEFYRDYAIHFGNLAKQRMTKIINSPGYQRMPDEEKARNLDRELRHLRYGEAMRAKREYVREYGMPTEEMNLKKRIGGY